MCWKFLRLRVAIGHPNLPSMLALDAGARASAEPSIDWCAAGFMTDRLLGDSNLGPAQDQCLAIATLNALDVRSDRESSAKAPADALAFLGEMVKPINANRFPVELPRGLNRGPTHDEPFARPLRTGPYS